MYVTDTARQPPFDGPSAAPCPEGPEEPKHDEAFERGEDGARYWTSEARWVFIMMRSSGKLASVGRAHSAQPRVVFLRGMQGGCS